MIFKGSGPVLLGNPINLFFFHVPPLDPHMALLMVQCVDLQCVIVVFLGHTHLLFEARLNCRRTDCGIFIFHVPILAHLNYVTSGY